MCPNRDCGLVWPDPMPLPTEIWKAYARYYTHATDGPPKRSLLRQIYRQAKRNWLTASYGYPPVLPPSSPAHLRFAHYLVPTVRRTGFKDVRLLDFVAGGRLLDVGCGSGSWLVTMKELGWNIEGVDFDPEAVRVARELGLNVQVGSVEAQNYPSASFDAITLSHVIEHVPDPVATVAECARLLKPGGKLVLFTPNAASFCHRYFKKNWRGLEPPRHLHIFTVASMHAMLARASFSQVAVRTHVGTSVTYESRLLQKNWPHPVNLSVQGWRRKPLWHLFDALQHSLVWVLPSVGECLTAIAVK